MGGHEAELGQDQGTTGEWLWVGAPQSTQGAFSSGLPAPDTANYSRQAAPGKRGGLGAVRWRGGEALCGHPETCPQQGHGPCKVENPGGKSNRKALRFLLQFSSGQRRS